MPTARPTPTPIVLLPSATPLPVKQPPRTVQPFTGRPESGELRTFREMKRVATMSVKTSAGSDYLVRLYESDHMILSVFIRGGETETFKVPLGTFELKFASGTQWLGYWDFFGQKTSYMKADETFTFRRGDGWIDTCSITLYTVPGGNLELSPIPASEF